MSVSAHKPRRSRWHPLVKNHSEALGPHGCRLITYEGPGGRAVAVAIKDGFMPITAVADTFTAAQRQVGEYADKLFA